MGEIMGRWLAVDFGHKRIGIAISDPTRSFVSPLTTLKARRNAQHPVDEISRLVDREAVVGVVVGLPYNMDGSEGPQAAASRRFAERLRARLTVPVELFDERLSSFAADERLRAAGVRGKRRTELRDALAAQAILEAFLEAQRRERNREP
jgi:putative Holliday junction resolvase